MKNVQKIIDAIGGLKTLQDRGSVRIESPGFMPLSLDYLGIGPRGLPMIAVAHNFVQNGDVMADPDMQFEIDPNGGYHPVNCTQSPTGSYHEAVYIGPDGKVYVRPGVVRDLKAFARMWDRNIGAQGFLKAAEGAGQRAEEAGMTPRPHGQRVCSRRPPVHRHPSRPSPLTGERP